MSLASSSSRTVVRGWNTHSGPAEAGKGVRARGHIQIRAYFRIQGLCNDSTCHRRKNLAMINPCGELRNNMSPLYSKIDFIRTCSVRRVCKCIGGGGGGGGWNKIIYYKCTIIPTPTEVLFGLCAAYA